MATAKQVDYPNYEELKKLIEAEDFDERRVCNFARNSLLAIIGTFPAEWDLVIAPHSNESFCVQNRKFFKGVSVYAEDIRSPFNIGSIFRTAEAMGCENVFISPNCTDPNQSRALRSGMGCIETLGYKRCSLEELPQDKPVFVLETGGTPITEFSFPKEGIVIIDKLKKIGTDEVIRLLQEKGIDPVLFEQLKMSEPTDRIKRILENV